MRNIPVPVAPRPRLLSRAKPNQNLVLKRRGQLSHATEAEIKITSIFPQIMETKTTTVCLRGGARSSKSYSFNQFVTDRFFSCPGIQILLMRKTLPALRVSTYKQLEAYMKKLGLWQYVHENRQTLDWEFNGSCIHFSSLDDYEKIKSTEWNLILLEEATEFTYQDYTIAKTRLSGPLVGNRNNQIFLLFNPEDENCWIKSEVLDRDDDCTELVSTYKDNPFLPDSYVKILENLKNTDSNHWRIYGLGEWGKLDALIYTNWRKIALENIPTTGDTIYGLDFGFNNPSALLKIKVDSAEAYIHQLIYAPGLTNTQLIEQMKTVIPYKERSKYPIYADNAEPDRIEEINTHGFWCVPCYKGTVKQGIDHVKRYRQNITEESDETLKEIRSYSWKKDKNERMLDEPIAFNDHAMACIRYALLTHNIGLIQGIPDIKTIDINEDKSDGFDEDFPDDFS